MEPITGLVVALSAAANVVLAFFGLFQRAKKRKANEQLDTVSEGLKIIETAIEENKHLISQVPAGKQITKTIKAYGTLAAHVVDKARGMAAK